MARIEVPDGPGGEGAMVWTLRPEMAGMVGKMITTAYQASKLPAAEREVARMRVAQLNACGACATFRAPSVVEAGVTEDTYSHLPIRSLSRAGIPGSRPFARWRANSAPPSLHSPRQHELR